MQPIVVVGRHHDHGLAPLLDHALRTVRVDTPEQLTEARLRFMQLPGGGFAIPHTVN